MLSFVIFFVSGCALLQDAGVWQQPEVRVTDMRLTGLTMHGASLGLEIEVFNPNPYSIHLGALDYSLDIQEARVISGKQTEGNRLDAGQRRKLVLPLELEFGELAKLVQNFKDMKSFTCRFAGGMSFEIPVAGMIRVPLSAEAEIPVPEFPGIRVAGMSLEHLSLGGAEMKLRLAIKNPNSFTLLLEHFNYSLALNGSPVAEGQVDRKMAWDAGMEEELEIPLRLSFSEAGLALYNALRRSGELDYRFGFESEMGSSLPVLKNIPFKTEQQGRVALTR